MFLMSVMGFLSLINMFIKNIASKSFIFIHLFTNVNLKKKYFRGKKLQTCKENYNKRN